jgi:hypothetical protein
VRYSWFYEAFWNERMGLQAGLRLYSPTSLMLVRFQVFTETFTSKFSRIGVMVSVLAIGPIVGGLKPGRGDGFLRAIKSAARLPAEGK